MTTKLKHTYYITEKRLFGKVTVNQEMVIQVDYDGETIDNVEVLLFENGKYKCEISKLLDEAKVLDVILEAIDWNQLYHEHKMEGLEYLNEEA